MTFLHRPQSLLARKLLFQLHLWTGIGVGLYIFLIGVTGSALVFRQEMQHALHSGLVTVSRTAGHPADLVEVAERMRRAYPGYTLTSVSQPSAKEGVDTITGYLRKSDDAYIAVYAHPVTGQILGMENSEGSFLRWLQQLDFNLLAGRSGRVVNGVGALFLLLLCVTGLVIWWPGLKNWKRSMRVDFRRKWKRVNWDLHSAAGFWSLAILSMWALTGAYFAWPDQFRQFLNTFSKVSLAKVPRPDLRAKGAPPPNLHALVAQAQSRSPGAHFSGISFPADDRGVIRIYMSRAEIGDYTQSDYHYFDPFTAKHLLVWRRGLNESVGDLILSWIGPIHFGTFGGTGVKILWLVFGLMPPLLFVTGSLMYWNRSLSKKWASLKRPERKALADTVAAH